MDGGDGAIVSSLDQFLMHRLLLLLKIWGCCHWQQWLSHGSPPHHHEGAIVFLLVIPVMYIPPPVQQSNEYIVIIVELIILLRWTIGTWDSEHWLVRVFPNVT